MRRHNRSHNFHDKHINNFIKICDIYKEDRSKNYLRHNIVSTKVIRKDAYRPRLNLGFSYSNRFDGVNQMSVPYLIIYTYNAVAAVLAMNNKNEIIAFVSSANHSNTSNRHIYDAEYALKSHPIKYIHKISLSKYNGEIIADSIIDNMMYIDRIITFNRFFQISLLIKYNNHNIPDVLLIKTNVKKDLIFNVHKHVENEFDLLPDHVKDAQIKNEILAEIYDIPNFPNILYVPLSGAYVPRILKKEPSSAMYKKMYINTNLGYDVFTDSSLKPPHAYNFNKVYVSIEHLMRIPYNGLPLRKGMVKNETGSIYRLPMNIKNFEQDWYFLNETLC